MNSKLITVSLCFALASCGGSGGGSSNSSGGDDAGGGKQVQTGSVNGLSGVAYETDTQSGVLDADGHFQYELGETITLSLGGIALGSTKADVNLSLTDFLGDLPTTAAEFRTQMRVVDQGKEHTQVQAYIYEPNIIYAISVESDLHKATNILSILMGMDSDADASNGLDLASNEWHKKLANVTGDSLTLNYPMLDFAKTGVMQRFQQQHGFILTPVIDTVDYLYDLANINIAVKPRVGARIEDRKKTEAYGYDDQQRLIQKIEKTVNDSNEETRIDTVSYTYNDQGQKTEERLVQDTDADGVPNSTRVNQYEYNAQKQMSHLRVQWFSGENTTPYYDVTTTSSYMNDGVLKAERSEVNNLLINSDPAETTYAYSDQGLLLSENYSSLVGSKDDYVFEYNSDGLITSYTHSSRYNSDGEPTDVKTRTNEYAGNETTETYIAKFNGSI